MTDTGRVNAIEEAVSVMGGILLRLADTLRPLGLTGPFEEELRKLKAALKEVRKKS